MQPQRIGLTVLVSFLLVGAVVAQSLPVPSAADLAPTVSGAAVLTNFTGRITYSYRLSNSSSSHQAAMMLAVDFGLTNATVQSSPFRWGSSDQIGEAHLLGWSALVGSEVPPGGSVDGFVIDADGLPGVTNCYVVGDVPLAKIPVYPKYSAPDVVPGSSVVENSVHLRTIGPVPVPSSFQAAQFLQTIASYKEQSLQQGWISNRGIANSLDAKLNAAQQSLTRGNTNAAKNQLNALLNEVAAQSGKQLTSEAVALLKFNTQYLISKLP